SREVKECVPSIPKVTSSGFGRILLAGLAAGAAGALIWGAIAYFAHLEVGIVAWGIGFLVGCCVRLADRSFHNKLAGVTAGAVALVSILAGKFLAAVFVSNWLLEAGRIPGNVPPEAYWQVVGFTFRLSFGFVDTIFFMLAIGTAFRLGSSND